MKQSRLAAQVVFVALSHDSWASLTVRWVRFTRGRVHVALLSTLVECSDQLCSALEVQQGHHQQGPSLASSNIGKDVNEGGREARGVGRELNASHAMSKVRRPAWDQHGDARRLLTSLMLGCQRHLVFLIRTTTPCLCRTRRISTPFTASPTLFPSISSHASLGCRVNSHKAHRGSSSRDCHSC